MKITATWRTAFLAGIWSGVGALLFVVLVFRRGVEGELRSNYFLAGLIPFFVIPVFLFVFGSSTGIRPAKHLFELWGRGFCWMGGFAFVVFPGLQLVT
jgi:hypothetical protein